jgi:hypothetical protein
MRNLMLLLVLVAGLSPLAVQAAGGHAAVGCAGCHRLKDLKGGAPFCLACHTETAKGGKGFLPVSQHTSHPFSVASVNARKARVPAELLRDGKFECLACHDPHPSNPHFRYLRVDVGPKGEKLDAFCSICHAAKADQASERLRIFSSMDESGGAPASTPPPPAKPAPAKK